jgi:hypothetical protein
MKEIDLQKEAILVTKASGETEVFSTQKLEQSLIKAGAKQETISHIVKEIERMVYPGISTKQIYERAFGLLKLERTESALRYRLKRAIFDLGPTGYPFEILIGEIFKQLGYKTEVGVVVSGLWVTHEMDVIATKENVQHLVECKFHKDQGHQVSVQVPLYVHSRVEDITQKRKTMAEYSGYHFETWVVTNTRFTEDAGKYGTCSGMHLISWNFPAGNALKELIERYKIYPLTILNSLSIQDKQFLLDKGLVSCAQLSDYLESGKETNFSKRKLNALKNELKSLNF